jgi:alkylation response protein AidB-like acyl-CoA dehydrogenase
MQGQRRSRADGRRPPPRPPELTVDFALSARQQTYRALARTLAHDLPDGSSIAGIAAAATRAGLTGAEGDLLALALVIETMAMDAPASAVALGLHLSTCLALPRHSRLASGTTIGSMALSSDALPAIVGESENGRVRLSGRVAWVAPLTANGVAVVGARRDRELVACAVELDAAGVRLEPVETAALRGLPCGHIDLDDVHCEAIGPPRPIMGTVRIFLAAAGLGMGRRALLEALTAARVLNRSGAGGEQTVQGLLADAATELDAAELLMWKAAIGSPRSLADASMAKLAATDAAQGAAARATQVVGADSFRAGHVIEQLAQHVRALELFAGRTEALREAIADEYLPPAS